MVGLYSMANDLAHLPTSKISSVMNMLSTPVLAELQSDVDAMRLAFYRALRLTSAVVLPTCAGIALVADEMVAVLLGPKWSAAVPLVRLLSIYTALRAIDVLLPPVLFARRRERFLLWYCLALLVTVPGAAILGALWNGAVGMVAFYGPCYFVIMSFMARRALAELSGTISELFSQIWPILIAVAAMVPTIAIMREFGPLRQNTSEFVQLILLTATGGVAYVVALFAIGRPILKEAAEVVGWIICRQRG